MDRARKSLASLRQAASLRPAPSPNGAGSTHSSQGPYPSLVRSPSIGSPSSGPIDQESGNPMFDLARAASPTRADRAASSNASVNAELKRAASPSNASLDAELRRAAAPSTSSMDAELRRAATPSFASVGSANGRVVNSAATSNPILSREFAGMGINPASHGRQAAKPISPASTQLTSVDPEDLDPAMNKQMLSSTRGSTMNLLRAPQRIVVVPARFIKEKTWGTPRRRACTSVCMLIFAIIFIYLVVRIVDTLKILNSSPSLASFQVADLCSEDFPMSISGLVLNPSSAGATIKAMRTEVWVGNASIADGTQLVAYVDTPDIFIGPGNTSIAVSFSVSLPVAQGPYIRQVLKDYLASKPLDAVAKIPLTASFAADVFIIPISYSTNLDITFRIPSFNMSNSSTSDSSKPQLVQKIELLQPHDVNNNLLTEIALQLFTMKDFSSSFIDVTVPPVQFDVYFGDYKALSGATSFFHYGKNLPSTMSSSELGQISVQGMTGQSYIQGVQYGLRKFMNKTTLPVRAVLRSSQSFSNSEISSYKLPTGGSCYIQNVLDGFDYSLDLDLNSSSSVPSTSPAKDPYFQLLSYTLLNIDASEIISNQLGIDLNGMHQLYNLQGVVPNVQIYIDVDGVNSSMPRVPLVYFDLYQSFSFYPNNSVVPAMNFHLQLLSATHSIRVANQYLINNVDVPIHVRTSASGSILSRLLSAVTIDFSIKELMNSMPSSSPSSRRLGNQMALVHPESRQLDSVLANKSIVFDVTSSYIGFGGTINAQGFDSHFFGGIRISWKRFYLEILIRDPYDLDPTGWLTSQPFFVFDLSAYDSQAVNPTVTLSLKIQNDSPDVVYGVINQLTVDYAKVWMKGRYKYNNAATFAGDDFFFERTKDVVNTTSEAAPTFSFFQLYHAEILNLTSNNFFANVYFGLDLGDVQLTVNMPQIALALSRCGEPHFVAVVLNDWSFRTTDFSAFAPLQLELEDASRVLNFLTTYVDGDPQQICILGHPTLAENFLSYFIGSVGLNLKLNGRSPSAQPVGQEADLLALEITSDSNNACVSLNLNLTDPTSTDVTTTSIGWGAVDFTLTTSGGTPADFLHIQIDEGWYGRIDDYRRIHFAAPSTIKSVGTTICLLADTSLALSTAQAATRGVFQDFYDGIAIPVDISGTLKRRIPPTSDVSVISAHFTAPASTFQSLKSLSSTTSAANVNTTDWFSLEVLEIISFNGDTFDTRITFETGSIGFNVSIPAVNFHVGKLTTPGVKASELKLFEISTSVPPFGFEENFPLPVSLGISLIPPQDWGDTLQLIDDFLTGTADVAIGASTVPSSNLLSQVIPTISFSLSKKDVVAPPTPGPDRLDVDISASSSQTSATILASFTVLARLDYKFIWGTINCRLYDGVPGASNEIGRVTVPGQILQEVGTGPQNINVTLYGQATAFAKSLFNGSAVVVGFQGTIGSSTFTSSFKIPKSVTDSLALGSPGSSSEATSSLKIIDAAILGSSEPGKSGTLPCLIDSLCKNTIRGDGDMQYDGITAGATLLYTLPDISRVRWRVSLNSNVFVSITANGFLIGKVSIYPISVVGTQSQFSPVFSVLPNNNNLVELRYTIKAFLDGYDTVFTLGGDPSSNYISNLLSAIQQDVAFLDVPPPDPNAPSLLQELKLSVLHTVRTQADLGVNFNLAWQSDNLVLSIGSVGVKVMFGHSKTCGASHDSYCLDGLYAASASTSGSLVIRPNPEPQPVFLAASVFHSGGVLSPAQVIVDKLISSYIWELEMPLELNITLTPVANNYYGIQTPFVIQMFVTMPPGAASTGFIDAINVNVLGTLESSLGDVTIKAQKVLKNTLDFPLLVSYYQYDIRLVDQDGVFSGSCLTSPGLLSSVNPCSIPLLNLCYSPWNVPTSVGPLITSADINQLKPGNSLLDNQKYLPPNGGKGSTTLTINPTIETASRLVDEMLIKGTMCGDIMNGMFIVSLQADPNCNDADKSEADLTCTYPIRITFDLHNYALSPKDTCGSTMDVPQYKGFTFYDNQLYQFDTPWAPGPNALNTHSTPVTMVDGSKQTFTRSDDHGLNILDSFEIQLDVRIAGAGCLFLSEAMSITFTELMPAMSNSPEMPLNCGATCPDRYASRNIQGAGNYASLVLAFYGCNSLDFVINGDSVPYRGSQSCVGDLLDNGDWGTVTFTYNAHDKRATASYFQGSYVKRSFDFDLDLYSVLAGSQYAFLSFIANTGSSTCATVQYRNFVRRSPRTNGAQTTLEGSFSLPQVNTIGSITFRARDENGRKRGAGGNTWLFDIRDAVTNLPANQNMDLATRFVDHNDGTYTLYFQIYSKGRFTVSVACETGTDPNICNNANQYVLLTNGLFVRA